MDIEALPEKTKFDVYFAADIVAALKDAQQQAARVELDAFAVDQVIAHLARRFRLEVTP